MFPLQPEATEWVAGKEIPHFNWYARKELSPVPWNAVATPPDEGLIRRIV